MTKELLFSFSKKDFRVDTFRSGGKGGQHQNKTNSGIRITHIESGLAAECREERSQTMNKKKAFRKLAKKLIEYYLEREKKERYEAGFEVVRTYHEPDDRIVDHSSGRKYSFKQTVGKGDISLLIEDRLRDIMLKGGES